MEFTKFERIQLINQYEILKIINPGEKENYEELFEILFNGYSVLYDEIEGYISEDMPVDEGVFVLDIVSLYRDIEGFKAHNESKAIKDHPYGNFSGFDGNNEGNYYRMAKFLIDKQRRFCEQEQYREKNNGFNSHWPMLSQYRNMIFRWERLGRKHHMSEAEILGIINV
ncbi:MAG: YfbU family protein [Anaerolineales bacterium]